MKNLITLAIFCLGFLAIKPANAYVYNVTTPSSQLIVDKKVRGTGITDFQDNISASQKTFGVGDTIEFTIKVKNSGDKNFSQVNLTDILPSGLNLVKSDPLISINIGAQNQLNWQLATLNAGSEANFRLTTVLNTPIASTACLINKATATTSDGESDSDTASFCLANIPPTLPKNGPENLLLIGTLISTFGTLGGLGLRRFARGY